MQDNSLKRLSSLGVSPWYDNIERRLISSGALKELFDCGIRGVTSNPTIFEKAINSSSDYDARIADLSKDGLNTQSIYDELTVWDVSAAGDLLRAVYEESYCVDGYVSIEVLPEYAYNVPKTIDYARYIFKKINRPNIMIKVPGTREAQEAIYTLISEGINVNVTLIFSLEHYRNAARAYIKGLKKRLQNNKPLNTVNSVASVFVSRIDTAVDKLLDGLKEKDSAALKGQAAIANCGTIYQSFKELFRSEDYLELKNNGAHIQRVLWASTGAKNPAYSDIKYVDGLVGRDTINTMPDVTVKAYLDHGAPKVSLRDDNPRANSVLEKSLELGIDINKVCQELQDKGVQLFADSFSNLIASIENKRKQISRKSKVSIKS